MDPKELRAAKERVRYGQETGCQVDDYDYRVLAVAYLAEHPADEEEPLSVEWLDKCLPRSKDMGFSGEVLWQFGPFDTLSMYPEREDVARIFACEIRTRGRLRRLCAALGVPLTESKR